MLSNLSTKGKITIGVIILLIIFGILAATGQLAKITSGIETAANASGSAGNTEQHAAVDGECIVVGVDPWVGYAGLEYQNNGFEDNEGSRFRKDGVCIDIVSSEQRDSQIAAFKSGDIDVLWGSLGTVPTEIADLPSDTRIAWNFDHSQGGDVAIAVAGIDNLNELRGKKVAFPYRSPGHLLMLFGLEAAGMQSFDITGVQTDSPVNAAAMFKAGAVDAAFIWSPDDEDALAEVEGSTRIISTKEAPNLIYAVALVREGWANEHRTELEALYRGWMNGNVAVETDPAAQAAAIPIMAKGYNIPADFFEATFDNAYRVNAADNLCFFGISTDCPVTGEQVYDTAVRLFKGANVIRGQAPAFQDLIWTDVVESVSPGLNHTAVGQAEFEAPTSEDATRPAISTKAVSVTFPTGSAQLTTENRSVIREDFGSSAALAGNTRIRVTGNTDNVGNNSSNLALSQQRAQSVADYLATEYGFDRNRFIVSGAGSNNPVSSNDTEQGRTANRRTDLELVSQ